MNQDQFFYNQQYQPQLNARASNLQSAAGGNPCICSPGIGQAHIVPCVNYLPQNILEQIRSCVVSPSPIFILPNSQPIHAQQNSAPQPPVNFVYPNGGYFSQNQNQILQPPGYPYQIPFQFCDQFANQNHHERNSTSCDCCGTKIKSWSSDDGHRCSPGSDETVCTKVNCPSSLSLQALISQLLSLHGVISCAATRLALRKVPGSNVTTSVEETMERAQQSIGSLNKEQLVNEARNAQQVNGLINLHMVANPPQNVIPILTMIQLKVNSLRSIVGNLLNKSIIDCQSIGIDGNTNLESMILSVKSDAEIRELLGALREKECEERVNVSYAPYHSQKVIAESRLGNIQNKISQVESEMERRRRVAMPWINNNNNNNNNNGQFNQTTFSPGRNNPLNHQRFRCNDSNSFLNPNQVSDPAGNWFESPSPFEDGVKNPKRLNLKPNVGGPDTAHRSSKEENICSREVVAVTKLEKDENVCTVNSESRDEKTTELANDDEIRKKLKNHVDEKGELSVKKQSLEGLDVGEVVHLSPDVLLVIDKEMNKVGSKKELTEKESKKGRDKSPESIASNSTFDSEASISSSMSEDKEFDEKSAKSDFGNKGRKKKLR